MKKKLLGAAALLICLVLLCACNKSEEDASKEGPANTPFQNVYDDGGKLLVECLTAEDGTYNGKREFAYEGGQVKTRTYDKNDTLIQETAEEYDSQGNLILSSAVEHLSGDERIETQYTYYADGKKNTVTTKHYYDDISLCIWDSLVYNEREQLIQWNKYESSGELFWHQIYEYNGTRKYKTTTVNVRPYSREYNITHYNEKGEAVGDTYYDNHDNVIRESTYEWANGNQIKRTTQEYDSQGRISKETVNIPATGEETIAEYDYETRDPDTHVVRYTHFYRDDRQWRDANQYFEDMQLGVHWESSPTSKIHGQSALFYYHCENNRIYRISLGNHGNKNYHILFQYDDLGRRTGYKYYDPDNNLLETVVYQWDGDRLAKEVFSDGSYDQYRYNEDGVLFGYERYDAEGNLEKTYGSDFCPWVKLFDIG